MRPPGLVDVLLGELDEDALQALADRLAPFLRQPAQPQADGWLDAKRAAEYLGITRAALYQHTAARTIPFAQDGPNARCWFKRSELDAWRRGEHGSNHGSSTPQQTATNGRTRTRLHPVNTG